MTVAMHPTPPTAAAPPCPAWCDGDCQPAFYDPGTATHQRTVGTVSVPAEITGRPADRVDVVLERYDDVRGHSEPARVCVGGLHLDLAAVLDLQRALTVATVLIGCSRLGDRTL